MPRKWFFVTLPDGEPVGFFPTMAMADDKLQVQFWHDVEDGAYSTEDRRYAGRLVELEEMLAILFGGAPAGAVA